MNVKLPLALRNASLQLLLNAFDADTNPAYIEFYTAPQPLAAGEAITTQTLLGTWTLGQAVRHCLLTAYSPLPLSPAMRQRMIPERLPGRGFMTVPARLSWMGIVACWPPMR